MPFAADTDKLVGKRILIATEFGFGWLLIEGGYYKELTVPAPFEAEIVKILFDGEVARGILGKCNAIVGGRQCTWAYCLPHTDLEVDLRVKTIGCNLVLSNQPLYLSDAVKYPDPAQVVTLSEWQIRGFGRVKLLS